MYMLLKIYVAISIKVIALPFFGVRNDNVFLFILDVETEIDLPTLDEYLKELDLVECDDSTML